VDDVPERAQIYIVLAGTAAEVERPAAVIALGRLLQQQNALEDALLT
jgi:hypothetical protein